MLQQNFQFTNQDLSNKNTNEIVLTDCTGLQSNTAEYPGYLDAHREEFR